MKQKGLGRGLSALLGEESEDSVNKIKIQLIEPNKNQPRRYFDDDALRELSQSIEKNGVITPIVVRKVLDAYQIIAGERRWRAARMAGLSEIPAVVLEITEQEAYEIAIIENLQREDLNAIEEAMALRTLARDYNMSQEQIAAAVSKSRTAVSNSMRLLSLPDDVLEKITQGRLSAGHGRAILALKNTQLMSKVADAVVVGELSVRATEHLVERMDAECGKEARNKVEQNMIKIYVAQLERKLSKSTGRKINITNGKKSGKISIEYYGNEDLEELTKYIEKMNKRN